MNRLPTVSLLVVGLLVTVAATPAAAIGPDGREDECQNATEGPAGDAGPPGFVSGIVGGVAGFLGELFASLPVPNFVKGFFGASTC